MFTIASLLQNTVFIINKEISQQIYVESFSTYNEVLNSNKVFECSFDNFPSVKRPCNSKFNTSTQSDRYPGFKVLQNEKVNSFNYTVSDYSSICIYSF